jgi:hypothetical protein
MNSSNSIYDVIEALGESVVNAAGRLPERSPAGGEHRQPTSGGEQVGGLSAPAAVAGGPPDYLESGGKYCEKVSLNEVELKWEERKKEEKYEVVPCGCRSRFCKNCCIGLGLSLRERLLPVLETFKGLMMWTFTVDPKLFPTPAAAFAYVRDKRCIASVMRELRRRGFLHTGRYFFVVEWQMGQGDEAGTLMAHWHVLADADFIPVETVRQLWDRFRPDWAGPVEGDRPGFGSVWFSAPKFNDAKHAACYACKYLIKYPEKEYPQWVLDSHNIHRFSTSRGFWPPKAADEATEPTDDDSSASSDGSEQEDDQDQDVEDEAILPAARTTIAERLAKCGQKSVVVRVVDCVDPGTGEVSQRREFVCRLDASVATVAEALGMAMTEGRKKLDGLPRSALRSMSRFRERLGHQ